MRRLRSIFLGASLVGFTSGCSFVHMVPADPNHTVRSDDGDVIRGYVHVETWTPAFLYVFPLLPHQSPERAQDLATDEATEMGADAIIDVRHHVETHMPFFWLAGWTENHVSATAVSTGSPLSQMPSLFSSKHGTGAPM